jgi:hypothetical protein
MDQPDFNLRRAHQYSLSLAGKRRWVQVTWRRLSLRIHTVCFPGTSERMERDEFRSTGCALPSQRGTEPIPALFDVNSAPICALIAKLAIKPGEKRQIWVEKWRELALFWGQKRHFRRAVSRWPWVACRKGARLYGCGLRLRPAACDPPNRKVTAIYHPDGCEPT